MIWGNDRTELGPFQGERDVTDVGMHVGVGGPVSGDGEAGWMGKVIYIYPYVPRLREKHFSIEVRGFSTGSLGDVTQS